MLSFLLQCLSPRPCFYLVFNVMLSGVGILGRQVQTLWDARGPACDLARSGCPLAAELPLPAATRPMFHALVGKLSQASSFPQAYHPIHDGGVQPLFWIPGTAWARGLSSLSCPLNAPWHCQSGMWVVSILPCSVARQHANPSSHAAGPCQGRGGSNHRAGLGNRQRGPILGRRRSGG